MLNSVEDFSFFACEDFNRKKKLNSSEQLKNRKTIEWKKRTKKKK